MFDTSLYLVICFFLASILKQKASFHKKKTINLEKNESIELRFENRKARLNTYCKNYNTNRKLNLEEYKFIENLPRPLIFCIPKKVGSTSLSYYFPNFVDEEDQLSWMIGPVHNTRENIFLTRDPLKAMITRHPLERIASAFTHLFKTGLQDFHKFLCAKGSDCKVTQNAYLAEKIIEQLRPGTAQSVKGPDLEFREFVTFLIDSEGRFGELKREMEEDFPGLAAHWEPYHR